MVVWGLAKYFIFICYIIIFLGKEKLSAVKRQLATSYGRLPLFLLSFKSSEIKEILPALYFIRLAAPAHL